MSSAIEPRGGLRGAARPRLSAGGGIEPLPVHSRSMLAMQQVIVTQCHVRFGFNVTRSLARAGFRVVAGGQQIPTMCHGVDGVVGEFAYPDPFADPDGYIAAIRESAERTGADVLLPVHEDIFVAARFRKDLPSGFRVLTPPFEALMRVHDKLNLARLAQGTSIECPPTRLVQESADLARAIDAFGNTPVIAKPRFGEGTSGVVKIASLAELRGRAAALDRIFRREPYIVQPFVRGVGIGVGCLVVGGLRVATCQHLRLREVPLGGGTSTARLTHWDETLVEPSFALMRAAGIDGIAMLEYRHDREADRFYLLDVNPRYWGGLSTHIESGVDFPRLHLEAALRGIFPTSPATPSQLVETRWTLGEMRVAIELMLRLRLRELRPLFFPGQARRIVYEEFASGGLLPFLVQARAYLLRALRKLVASGSINEKARFFVSALEREPGGHDPTRLVRQ
jgi:predicted ATP-grasp superfamily ATP-dependent carboligase